MDRIVKHSCDDGWTSAHATLCSATTGRDLLPQRCDRSGTRFPAPYGHDHRRGSAGDKESTTPAGTSSSRWAWSMARTALGRHLAGGHTTMPRNVASRPRTDRPRPERDVDPAERDGRREWCGDPLIRFLSFVVPSERLACQSRLADAPAPVSTTLFRLRRGGPSSSSSSRPTSGQRSDRRAAPLSGSATSGPAVCPSRPPATPSVRHVRTASNQVLSWVFRVRPGQSSASLVAYSRREYRPSSWRCGP